MLFETQRRLKKVLSTIVKQLSSQQTTIPLIVGLKKQNPRINKRLTLRTYFIWKGGSS